MTTRSGAHLFNRLEGVQTALLSDLAAEQILGLIHSGQLPAGSRLPAERDLAQQLGVSRTALREALRIVEATGVLEARVGRGRFVTSRPRSNSNSAVMASWLDLHHDEVAELNHVLQLIEPAGILELPTHLLPAVAAEARAVYERALAAIDADDFDKAAALDLDFHRSLCRRTPNRLLRDLIINLIQLMSESAKAVYSVPAAARNSLDQHLKIVSALEKQSREEASALLRDHAAIAHRFAAEENAKYPS